MISISEKILQSITNSVLNLHIESQEYALKFHENKNTYLISSLFSASSKLTHATLIFELMRSNNVHSTASISTNIDETCADHLVSKVTITLPKVGSVNVKIENIGVDSNIRLPLSNAEVALSKHVEDINMSAMFISAIVKAIDYIAPAMNKRLSDISNVLGNKDNAPLPQKLTEFQRTALRKKYDETGSIELFLVSSRSVVYKASITAYKKGGLLEYKDTNQPFFTKKLQVSNQKIDKLIKNSRQPLDC